MPMSNKQILVVDDEPFLSRALSFILKKEGYDVSIAVDGEDALQKVAENKPVLIFLDIMMPRKNGYEVCQIIKQIPELKEIYVVVLSAKGFEADKQKAFSVGADEFVSKPFNPPELIAIAKRVMAAAGGTAAPLTNQPAGHNV
jgi:two-component system, OmpR family, alkaline phosphatase synthesis response regulator PhoP